MRKAQYRGPGTSVSPSHRNRWLRDQDRRDGAGRMGAGWTWRAQEPHRRRTRSTPARRVDVARTGAAHLASPRTLPRHHAGPGQFGAFLVRKAHYLHFTPTMFPSPSSAPSAYGRPSTAKGHDAAPLDGGHPSGRPRPGSARARRPLRWASRGTKRGIGAPYGRPPPAMGGPGPADPNDLPPLAAGAETAPRGDLGVRLGRRPVHARSTTAIGPGRGGTRGAGPAARPSRYGRRSALRQDAAVRPRRRSQPCHQFHERWAPPRPVARRQAHDSVRGARSSPGAPGQASRVCPVAAPPPPRTRRMPPLNDRTH